jgi:hypothetical protein
MGGVFGWDKEQARACRDGDSWSWAGQGARIGVAKRGRAVYRVRFESKAYGDYSV